MSRILVTGAAGYIGSHVALGLLKEGHEVVAFDNFSRGYREPLEIISKYGKLSVFEGDLCKKEDIQKVLQNEKVDGVFHLAALCSVDESMKNPELYFRNNLLGTLNLLDAMRENNVRKIIFSSTCAIYGNAKNTGLKETESPNPGSPYAASKLMAEKMILWFEKLHGFQYIIFRYFNVCGADSVGEIGDSKKPSELLVQNAVRSALGIEEFKLTCPKVNTPDGTPIRDYVDVEDLAEAHMKGLEYLESGKSDIFNLGNGKGRSVKEIIDEVKKELGKDFDIKEGNTRKGEAGIVFADASKAKNALNWTPKKTLTQSIQTLAKWYNIKPQGYER